MVTAKEDHCRTDKMKELEQQMMLQEISVRGYLLFIDQAAGVERTIRLKTGSVSSCKKQKRKANLEAQVKKDHIDVLVN